MLTAIRPLLRLVRYLPDRLLHSSRRRRALAHLAGRKVSSATFICLGNINRSAYAAGAFGGLMADRNPPVLIRSAGFIGPDRPASDLALKVAAQRAVDLGGHRSRRVDAAELIGTDLIVVMDVRQRNEISRLIDRPGSQILILGDLDPDPADRRAIQDPYGHPEDVFVRVFDRIDRCLAQLAGVLP
ncbi:MAG TPA: hypothetical protein VF035_04125 [Longimicrobiales bacterium]